MHTESGVALQREPFYLPIEEVAARNLHDQVRTAGRRLILCTVTLTEQFSTRRLKILLQVLQHGAWMV